MDRRELLKLFTAGASIVPIIGGSVVGAAESKLITSPRVELAGSPSLAANVVGIPGNLDVSEPVFMRVTIDSASGSRWELQGKTFLLHQKLDIMDVGYPYAHDQVLVSSRLQWELKGEFLNTGTGHLVSIRRTCAD